MQVRRALLCDLVQATSHGKSNLLGVFRDFTVTGMPAGLQPFYLFAHVRQTTEGELVPGKTSFTIDFLNESGDLISATKGGVLPSDAKVDKDTWIELIVKFEGVEVKEYGVHYVSIKQDGKEIESIEANVIQKAT